MKNRRIKDFKTFITEKNSEKIEEGLFSKLKDSIFMAISKKIGGANKIDKQAEAFLTQMRAFYDKKINLDIELTKSKEAFEETPTDMGLKKAYELKQKAVEGQQAALVKQEDSLRKLFNANVTKIVGNDNPRLSMYAETVKAQTEFDLSDYTFKKYEEMGIEGDKLKEAEDLKKQKEVEMKEKQENLKAEMKMQKDSEKSAEAESGAELSLKNLKVGQTYMYQNSKGQDVKVKITDLFKNDKVQGQNGTMVKVKSEKTGGEFRVLINRLTSLTPSKEPIEKDQEGNIIDKNKLEKTPAAEKAAQTA